MSLSHLSSLLRKALRSTQGEDTSSQSETSSSSSSDESSSEDGDDNMSAGDGDGEGVTTGTSTITSARRSLQAIRARSTGSSTRRSANSRNADTNSKRSLEVRKRRDSKHDANEGGYLRLLSEGLDKSEKALERDTELVRLEKENRDLRELLGIEKELPAVEDDISAGMKQDYRPYR